MINWPIDFVITFVYTFVEGNHNMNTHLKRIGNSKGVVIPSGILKLLGIKESDELQIKVEGNDIILTKADQFDPKSLEELFKEYKEAYDFDIVFDDTKGREVW
jgi:antitoxin MazE